MFVSLSPAHAVQARIGPPIVFARYFGIALLWVERSRPLSRRINKMR